VKDETRRKLLKGLAVTIPAAWTRPIVESVVLPAHAVTTGSTYFSAAASRERTNAGEIGPIWICAVLVDNSLDVTTQGTNNTGRRRGTIPLSGTGVLQPQQLSADTSCEGFVLNPQNAVVEAISASSVSLLVTTENTGFRVTVPASPCGAPPPVNGICPEF